MGVGLMARFAISAFNMLGRGFARVVFSFYLIICMIYYIESFQNH